MPKLDYITFCTRNYKAVLQSDKVVCVYCCIEHLKQKSIRYKVTMYIFLSGLLKLLRTNARHFALTVGLIKLLATIKPHGPETMFAVGTK